MLFRNTSLFSILALNVFIAALAQAESDSLIFEEVVITASDDSIRSLTGSAEYLGQQEVKEFDSTDLNELLGRVPGVYIRTEDGYGLRPNIGIRGVTSDRSQKITIMEDGILITPAPYSAPAAYYIPNVNRMNAVEVYKGPSSISHGPHTVGGSLNLVTQPIPDQKETHIGFTIGSDSFFKTRIFHGDNLKGSGWAKPGYWIDFLRYQSNGFKVLDGGGDTGFERNDINAKIHWQFDANKGVYQELQMKVGFADEDSNETYMGLSDADFIVDPDRRYAASAPDNFKTEHMQLHIIHSADFNNGWVLTNKAYLHRFDRAWFRFGDLSISPYNRLFITAENIDILTGRVNSTDDILYTNNAREYGSFGFDTRASFDFTHNHWDHAFVIGARYHHDYIERDHKQFTSDFVNGLLSMPSLNGQTSDEKAQTDAISIFLRDELTSGKWTFNAGIRAEIIDGTLVSKLDPSKNGSNNQTVFIPGAGVFYQWSDDLGFLVGVNKGFSPAGPSATADPEESTNLEYGLRYSRDDLYIDLIGFFSDYDNLLGRCRQSDLGCVVGDEFNGGKAEVGGIEFSISDIVDFKNGLVMPVSLTYTFSESAFQQSFFTGFSQWSYQAPSGITIFPTKGDQLPYIPDHQARIQLGLHADKWAFNAAMKYVGEMREVPGVGSQGVFTDEILTIDLGLHYEFSDHLTLKLVGENITDERKIVSRRPLGARPNAPRAIKIGAEYRF